MRIVFVFTAIMTMQSPAFAAGDLSLASCKGWSGTITEREGNDNKRP